MKDPLRRHPLLESAAVLLLTLPLALWQSAFWIFVPLALLVATNRPLDEYGLCWRLGPLRLHLVAVPIVLGGYAAGHALYALLLAGGSFAPRLPQGFALEAVHQLADVALPEEVFFRAYLQSRLNQAWGTPYRALGASWGWGLPVASGVFALCHLVYGDLTQLKVVFFGLFAGWLRERTGSIVAPVLYHAAANLLLQLLLASFSPS